jgi:hypothetical protein
MKLKICTEQKNKFQEYNYMKLQVSSPVMLYGICFIK